MKKTFYLFMVILSVVIFSCKKDDKSLSPSDLTGTKWITDDKMESIEFISKTQVNYYWQDYFQGKYHPQVENGIYTITENKIVIDFGYGDGDYMNGILEGNTITFAYDGEVFIVKKQ